MVEVEFKLLGPFRAFRDGAELDLGPAKQRILLAALAAEAGRPLSAETLSARLWDGDPPDNARRLLHTYVARVRRILAQAAPGTGSTVEVGRTPAGYRLVADQKAVDLHRFRHLLRDARRITTAPVDRLTLLDEAIRLWQGDPIADMTGEWATRLRQSLRQQRLDLVADWARCALHLGRYDEVAPLLEATLADNPLAEPLTVLLIESLLATGHHAEALTRYASIRDRIREELGVEPGPELRRLHQRLLRRDRLGQAGDEGSRPWREPQMLGVDRPVPLAPAGSGAGPRRRREGSPPGDAADPAGRGPGRAVPAARQPGPELDRDRVVAAAVAVADADGMAELSMRRVAVELDVSTVSLYGHVASEDLLVGYMIDAVLGEQPLPPPAPGWRAELEQVARAAWAAFTRHPWVAQAMSLTRPQLSPNGLVIVDRVLHALTGTSLSTSEQLHVHVMLISFVRGVAASLEPEVRAERDTGLTNEEWMETQEHALREVASAGSPLLRAALSKEFDFDLDTLFEFGLARMLDGLATRLE
ncbi:BTAD domain-containing putative transcriptional regulator [Micromonospora mangrovi]|uniref:BTAD domain-containing putative transcriptional regulator n=2 Tax=Micromonospora TaxID=1873 RepID=A0AAU7MF20_9ACTN